jgi:hypothetical protein
MRWLADFEEERRLDEERRRPGAEAEKLSKVQNDQGRPRPPGTWQHFQFDHPELGGDQVQDWLV